MKILILLTIFFSTCNNLIVNPDVAYQPKNYYHGGGTCIIAIIDTDRAWIAADSKQVLGVLSTDKLISSRYTCKIGVTNNIFYTFSSPYITLEALRHVFFNAYDEMKKAIENNNSFEEAFSQFDKKLSKHLTMVCKIDSSNNFQAFLQGKDSNVIFEALILTFINNKPVYKIRQYYNALQSKGKIQIMSDSSGEKDFSLPFPVFLGNHQSIDSLLNLNDSNFFDPIEIATWAPPLITLEAKSHPELVDTMINIIEIYNSNHYKWLIKRQSCQ